MRIAVQQVGAEADAGELVGASGWPSPGRWRSARLRDGDIDHRQDLGTAICARHYRSCFAHTRGQQVREVPRSLGPTGPITRARHGRVAQGRGAARAGTRPRMHGESDLAARASASLSTEPPSRRLWAWATSASGSTAPITGRSAFRSHEGGQFHGGAAFSSCEQGLTEVSLEPIGLPGERRCAGAVSTLWVTSAWGGQGRPCGAERDIVLEESQTHRGPGSFLHGQRCPGVTGGPARTRFSTGRRE